MSDLETDVHKYIKKPMGYLRDKDNPPVKIAVLDTGVDSKNPFIKGAWKANRIKALESFVKDDKSTEDSVGHGTHVAALLLNVAPDAQVYVAKVAQDENIPSDHNIAEVSLYSQLYTHPKIRKTEFDTLSRLLNGLLILMPTLLQCPLA
jgi:subtilisin family serine protease